MSDFSNQNINNLFKDLLKNKDLEHIFDNYDFNNYLHSALTNLHIDTTNYIKSYRLDLYQNHYPFFFTPIPNHMLFQLEQSNIKEFESFDIGSNFRFDILDLDIYATMQSISPFKFHPFSVKNTDALDNNIRINIKSDNIRFNNNEILLWISPSTSSSNFIKAKEILDTSNNITLKCSINNKEHELKLKTKKQTIFNKPFLMQAMLKKVSPKMFGYQAFEIPDLTTIENQQVKLEYININISSELSFPDDLNNLFTFNLMPVFSMLDDYAKPTTIDGSQEHYPITASRSTSHNTFYIDNEIRLNGKRLFKYDTGTDTLNYIIHQNDSGSYIKIKGDIEDLLDNKLEIFATWTQLIDISLYQDKSLKIISLDKAHFDTKVVYKHNFVVNNNRNKIDDFINLSNLVNYKIFNNSTIKSITKISNLNTNNSSFLEKLITSFYYNEEKCLHLTFNECNLIEKLQIKHNVAEFAELLNYLTNDNIKIISVFDKHLK